MKERIPKMDHCPLCGAMGMGVRAIKDHEFYTSLGTFVIEGQVLVDECKKCKEQFFSGELFGRWHRMILRLLLKKPRILSSAELRFIFSVLPYTQTELAKAVGKERSTLTRYKTGENPIDPLFDDALKQIIIDFLAGTETTLDRLRARDSIEVQDEPVRRLKA